MNVLDVDLDPVVSIVNSFEIECSLLSASKQICTDTVEFFLSQDENFLLREKK